MESIKRRVAANPSPKDLTEAFALLEAQQSIFPKTDGHASDDTKMAFLGLTDSPQLLFQRGDFKLLDVKRLDLPKVKTSNFSEEPPWIQHTPESVQHGWLDPKHEFFTKPLEETLNSNTKFPKARVHALQGHYEQILEMADNAGILDWSVVDDETPQERKRAEILTMTSFAVVKDANSDRLISWPRVQNELMPDPPYADLPTPDLFHNISFPENCDLGSFYFDIENMFHHIRLPKTFAMLCPFKSVKLSSLPQSLRAKLKKSFPNISHQATLRPCQKTLPMGFKWAVYISHTVANRCLHIAASQTLEKYAPPHMKNAQMHTLSQTGKLLKPQQGDLIMLHIIDDVQAICIDWPDYLVIKLNYECDSVFDICELPRKLGKSSPINRVIKDFVNFVGWTWDLRAVTIRPDPDKLANIIKEAAATIHAINPSIHKLKRIIGKLVWLLLGIRPALSVLRHAFRITHQDRKPTPSMLALVKRELQLTAQILPLSRMQLQKPTWRCVVAFDASEVAAGVSYAEVSCGALGPLKSLAHKNADKRSDLEQLKFAALIRSQKWITAFAHPWREPQHINVLEATAAYLALEWIASRSTQGFECIVLSDSQVVLGALRKGRTSSSDLALPVRRFAATVISHNLFPQLVYVPSELNPADYPSRNPQ